MRITELREAFRNWAIGEPFQNAFDLMELLTDPTPITEEGLRELGFVHEYQHRPVWVLGDIHAGVDGGLCAICGPNVTALAKSMGQLRGLLLFVGEQ